MKEAILGTSSGLPLLVWIVSISMGFLLLVILMGTVILIVGIAIGVQYNRRNRPPSIPKETSEKYEVNFKASAAVPIYEDITLVRENGEIQLSHNEAYGSISVN